MLVYILFLSIAIYLIAQFMPGIRINGFGTAIIVAIVYSIINFLFYNVMVILALPFIVLTLGLFIFVINAFLLWITDKLIDGFEIKDFKTTIFASILISLVNTVIRWLL